MEAAIHDRATYTPYVRSSTTRAHEPAAKAPREQEVAIAVSAQPGSLHLVTPKDEEFAQRRRISSEVFIPNSRSETVARVANAVIALIALVVLTPVMAIVALAVRLTSRGPVLYSQIRVGVDRRSSEHTVDSRRRSDCGGRPFRMYKFRTMRVDAEADGKAVWAQKKDPRVTPIGEFLRTVRLDELPQLYNVLRGDMNIVGPRPERPTLFAELRETIPEYPFRQRVKPGITGWAQINQAYDSCIDDVVSKVKFDLEYIRRQNLMEDLRIMAFTIPVMLLRRGGW